MVDFLFSEFIDTKVETLKIRWAMRPQQHFVLKRARDETHKNCIIDLHRGNQLDVPA